MASPLSQLEARYLYACQNQNVIPNSSMVLSLSEAKYKKARFGKCILEIYIDHLASLDIPPLIATLSGSLSDIDVVNIRQKSSNASLDGENLLLLFQAANQKLRIVDLINSSSWKDLLRDICQRGMACQILNLQFSPIRKLNMTGKFLELQTLNLDSSVHLTSFHVNCFSCMPKLTRLSMCETRVANLWTTTAALSKLHSLSELRFQNCSCCYDTGPCPTFGGVFGMVNDNKCSSKQQTSSYFGAQCISTENNLKQTIMQSADNALNSLFSKNCLLSSNESLESTTEELSDESDPDFSDTFTEFCRQNNPDSVLSTSKHSAPSSTDSSVSNTVPFLAEAMHLGRRLDNSKSFTGFATRGETCYKNDSSMSEVADSLTIGKTTGSSLENHISLHPSPICFERYYREYIVTSLPHLKVLDNIPIGFLEREQAKIIFKRYFECAPYNRQSKDSIVSILQRREANRAILSRTFSKVKQPFCRESNHSFLRSLSAAKAGSSTQTLHSISRITSGPNEESKSFRPRQFEYHPTDPRLMAFGTLDGELIVSNHESEKLVGYLPSVGTLNSILALCWLKKHPTKILAGSDNGSLQLNDVCKMPSKVTDQYHSQNACVHTFNEFQQLTSVHVNSTDDYFLASGYSKHVALYDMGSGRRLQIFKDLHKEHINVVKFAHHSPSLFATASFDKEIKMWDLRLGTSQPCYTAASSRGNVMLCFSPDDYYLLTSAVDNEVRQLLAVDGRLHTSFDIPFTGNSQNYTRSYYINGRDYIISGSCEEHAVRICCAQTGRRLRDVYLEGRGSRNSMYIQSLRGDPFRDFHMSILAAYWRPFSKSEIIKVNLLQSEECPRESTSI